MTHAHVADATFLASDDEFVQSYRTQREAIVHFIYDTLHAFKCSSESGWMSIRCYDLLSAALYKRKGARDVLLNEVELTSCACVLIGSKMKNRFNPSVYDLSKIANTSVDRLLDRELFVLATLQWDVAFTTPHVLASLFLSNLISPLRHIGMSAQTSIGDLANTLINMTSFDWPYLEYNSSILAAGACVMAIEMTCGVQCIEMFEECDPTSLQSCVACMRITASNLEIDMMSVEWLN